MMKRLTNEMVRVDESTDKCLGPLADLENMKPKLLDIILNGPTLNGVSKDVLRQIIRQLYSALAAYEATGCEPEEVLPKDKADEIALKLMRLADLESLCSYTRLRELAEADKEGRVVVLPCKVGDTVYSIFGAEVIEKTVDRVIINGYTTPRIWVDLDCSFLSSVTKRWDLGIGKDFFLAREEAEKALEAMKGK